MFITDFFVPVDGNQNSTQNTGNQSDLC